MAESILIGNDSTRLTRYAGIALAGLLIWLFVLHQLTHSPVELVSDRWMIVPISFVAAFFANATAVGGGFLFVPLFIVFFGLSPVETLKLSLATQAFGMTCGSLGWSRQYIDTAMLFWGSIYGVLGVIFGTLFLTIDAKTIKLLFLLASVLVLMAFYIMKKVDETGKGFQAVSIAEPRGYIIFALVCFVGGVVTSAAAIGIGEFVAVSMLLLFRFRIDKCIGTGVALLAVCSIAATAIHLKLGGIPFDYLVFTAPGVMLGGYCGAAYARRLKASNSDGKSPLKTLLIGIIVLDIAVMIYQLSRI